MSEIFIPQYTYYGPYDDAWTGDFLAYINLKEQARGSALQKPERDTEWIAWLHAENGGGAVTSVAGRTGVVTLTKSDVALGNVDNTADASKPVSTAQATAIALKQNLVTLTTTGSSGSATFNQSTGALNIPNYAGGGASTELAYINQSIFPGSSLPAGYTAVGSPTYAVSGGKLSFSGTGSTTYTKYVKSNLGTLTENNTLSATIVLDAAPSASLNGIAIGFESYNAMGYNTESIRAGIVTKSTDANYGKPFIQSPYNGTVVYGTTANTNLNSGDIITIALKHEGWIFRVKITNVTQGWSVRCDQEITNALSPWPGYNSSNPAIYHLGGSVSVSALNYTIHKPVDFDMMLIGNSITLGQNAADQYHRWVNLAGIFGKNIASGGGADVTQSVVDRLPEIVALAPRRVLIHDLAGNDILFGVSSGTWQANLTNIRNTLTTAGIEVIWTNGQPRNGTNETAQKTYIESTFTGDIIIDTWAALLGSGTALNAAYDSGDGTHPNNDGHKATANAINAALGFPPVPEAAASVGVGAGTGNVVWSVVTGMTDIGGGSVKRVSGTANIFDAFARSTQTFAAGDALVFQEGNNSIGTATLQRIVGLTAATTPTAINQIAFSIYLGASGAIYRYEAGGIGSIGTYAANDWFRIRYVSGSPNTIVYEQSTDGGVTYTPLATSGVTPSGSYYAVASFDNNNDRINSATK